MTSIYKEGTVTVTNGSYIVDGFNTRFKAIADVKPGDLFTVDGSKLYEIYLVESDTKLRIRGLIQGELYNGGNLTGSNYAIIRNFSSDTDATVAANVIALQQKWHRRENEMYGWFNAETEFATVTSIDGEQINVITPYGINALVSGPVNTDEFAFTIGGLSELTDLNEFLNGVYYTIEATLTNQPDDFGAGKKLVFTQADVNGFYQKIMDLNTGRQKYRVGVDVESATEWLQVNNGTQIVTLEQRIFNNEQALPTKLDNTTFVTFAATAITEANIEAAVNGLPISTSFATLQNELTTNDTVSKANAFSNFINGYAGTLQQYVADYAGSGGGGDITQAYYDANTVTFGNLSANVNDLSVITSLVSTQDTLTAQDTIAKANSAATKANAAETFINGQTGTIQELLSNYAQSSELLNYVTQASYDANTITKANLETEVNALGIVGDESTVVPDDTDQTANLTQALNTLISNGGGVLNLKRGDYIISSTLPIASNITIRGEGMPSYQTKWLEISDASIDEGKVLLTLTGTDVDEWVNHRLMSGDVVKIDGLTKRNGVQEIDKVFPELNQIRLMGSASSIGIEDEATIRLSVLKGGTIIRFHNHITGESATGLRFFDESDVRNFCLYDVGFVGPGINSVFGGGMRFRRIREPDGRSRAITGYDWKNVLIAHVAMDALRFDQLIHSYLGHLAINRCVGDAILFKAGPEGGTTTSVHIDTPYIQNVRRGISLYTAAYCTLTNPVVEGTSCGYYVNRGIGITLNSMASETIKFGDDGQGCGVTGYFVNCYGTVINAPTVYYNTEEGAWSKAAMVFIDPSKRTESPTAVINGGHIQWSLGQKIPVVATRWNEREGRLYVNVANDEGYVAPDGATGSRWIGNSFWDDSIQIYTTGCDRDPDFNDRYKVTSIDKLAWIQDQATTAARPPKATDDSSAGYVAFTAYWENTEEGTREGRYFCIDDTVGAAVWVKAEEIFEINFDARDYKVLDKEAENGECFVFRLGRNYGVDIATDNIQRVLATSTASNGDLNLKLDVSHLFPTRYAVTVNFNPFSTSASNPYAGDSPNEYVVKRISRENITFDSSTDDYIKVELIVGNQGNYVFHAYDGGDSRFTHEPDDLLDALNGYFDNEGTGERIYIEYEDNGVKTQVLADLKKVDIRNPETGSTMNLLLYFKATRFFESGESIDVDNCMLKSMNGTHTVNSVAVSEFSGMPCISVETTTNIPSKTSVTESVDYGVYVSPKWSAAVSNNITVDGLDSLFIYDKVGAISVQDSRNGQALANGTETTVSIAAANNYDFYGHFNNRGGNVWVVNQTYNTVTFGHDSVSNEKFTWFARRKKSPGIEAIYDRN